MEQTVKFFDTTLRDGEQTPGVHFSRNQKLEIASHLSDMGTDIIEAGFPASSEGDFEAVELISKEIKTPVICALARATEHDIETAARALKSAANPRIHVFLATSDIHLEHKLHMRREEALDTIYRAVKYASSFGTEIQFSAEDATRTDRDFLCKAIEAAVCAGADIINIPDTVGYITPNEFSDLFKYLTDNVPELKSKTLSAHCHNDLGLAVSNSLSAVLAGAGQVECTVNGLGERAGNAAFEEIAMAIYVKGHTLGLTHNINTKEIIPSSKLISSISGIHPAPNKSIVGINAFTHASGIHQHGVMCDRQTYEIIDPKDIGLNESTITLGKLSGKHAFAERADKLGYKLDDEAVKSTFARFKEIADKKSRMTDDDIRAIISEYLDGLEGKYRISSFQIQSGNKMKSMALITLSAGKELFTEAAPGDGPVDASFNAINKIAAHDTDSGEPLSVELISYGINAVTEGTDALGEAKVKIRAHGALYTGRGVSTDIIKASIKAYLNAVNKCISAAEHRSKS